MARLVLASSSSRRRELLTRAGIRFTVVEPPTDGPIPPSICADLAVQLVARQKAVAVAGKQPAGSFVIGADTIVVGPSGPLGKPGTPERAQAMLYELRGRRHTVLTGICVIVAGSDREALGLGRSVVKMQEYSDDAVHTYVNSGEPLDRSGAYAIQGGGGDLVDCVSGRIDTVVGLDVPLALRLLAEAGYPDPLPAATDVPLAPARTARRPLAPLRAAQRA
jgi:septum formation protein